MDYRTLFDDARDVAEAWNRIDDAANLLAGADMLSPDLRGKLNDLRMTLAQMEEDLRHAAATDAKEQRR
jgi:hypothetical protein